MKNDSIDSTTMMAANTIPNDDFHSQQCEGEAVVTLNDSSSAGTSGRLGISNQSINKRYTIQIQRCHS